PRDGANPGQPREQVPVLESIASVPGIEATDGEECITPDEQVRRRAGAGQARPEHFLAPRGGGILVAIPEGLAGSPDAPAGSDLAVADGFDVEFHELARGRNTIDVEEQEQLAPRGTGAGIARGGAS